MLRQEPCEAEIANTETGGVNGMVRPLRAEHEIPAGNAGWPSVAGAVASELFGYPTRDSRSDMAHARRAAAAFCRPGHDPLTVPPEENDAVLTAWRVEARIHLEPMRAQIDAIAQELERRGRLGWQEIQELIERHRPFAA